MFGKRKRAQALLAQALYEPLSEKDKAQLDTYLSDVPGLEEEEASLRALRDAVPAESEPFENDLRPIVMANLGRGPARRVPVLPRWAIAMAAFLVVASGVAYRIVVDPPAVVAPGAVADPIADTAVAAALDEADRLAESHDFAGAYTRLAAAVELHPQDPAAALACQRMADLAFDELQWYPQAFSGYDALRHRYASQFRSDPTNFTRLNLLDETRGPDDQYAALRALDTAAREANFGSLEDIAARRPATYLASAAAGEMARIAARDHGLASSDNPVRAMRLAANRSADPVVRSQLRLEIAHLLSVSPDGRDRAREIYEDLANGTVTTLAEAARKSLDNLDDTVPDNAQL